MKRDFIKIVALQIVTGLFCIGLLFGTGYVIVDTLNNIDVHQIIVDTGKEIKQIKKEINSED